MTSRFLTLSELVSSRDYTRADDLLVRILSTDESNSAIELTYGEVQHHSARLAVELLERNRVGDRVLLVCSKVETFIVGLFSCWMSGMVAVPIYPPSLARRAADIERMIAVIRDSGASCFMTSSQDAEALESIRELDELTVFHLETERSNSSVTALPEFKDASTPALIQYTSGSTGDPKGVVLTHANILANLALFADFAALEAGEHIVNWMPLYHDLGLSLFLCAPFIGGSATLLTPESFLRRPARWLEAISNYSGVLSGAPNFAYDYCSSRIRSDEASKLDLSCWRVAMNAAEPVKESTIDRFTAKFEPFGFAESAFMPCYGLAEATAYGTAGRSGPLRRCRIDTAALREDRVEIVDTNRVDDVQTLLGCGFATLGSEVRVVKPESGVALEDAQIGEIWLSGPQVGEGYWGRPELSSEVFGARIDGENGAYLRTGDLGFLLDGQLFVTGRRKDLIILHGKNHYPQDIEASVESCHDACRPGCSAAFAVEVDDNNRLVVVAEVRDVDDATAREIAQSIRRTISQRHGIDLHGIQLLPKRHIHKTSSGKIKRNACRDSYMTNSFEAIYECRWDTTRGTNAGALSTIDVLLSMIVSVTGLPFKDVVRDSPFAEIGITSIQLVDFLARIERRFGVRFDVSVFFECPTPSSLAKRLDGDSAKIKGEQHTKPSIGRAAIVGSACRLPGDIDNPKMFWTYLESGEVAVRHAPASRWLDTTLTPTGDEVAGFLSRVDLFDPGFFGLTDKEAQAMDPQQRLLLEVIWEAIDSSGTTLEELRESRTGVFVGISASDYSERNLRSGSAKRIDAFAGTANAISVAAGRIAYFLGTRGPAMAIDTACSSSLVALHTAARSLNSGDCDAAIVASVNVILSPAGHVYLDRVGAMSALGRCQPFSALADGYVRAEGCVAMVLRSEALALRRRDHIAGIVVGSSVNHDGRTNGLTAPSLDAQRDCYRSALRDAGIVPSAVAYIEAHGTGTQLGDPIELRGLADVYGSGDKERVAPIVVGAVKANLGHGEAVAGLTGVLKILGIFEHDLIPAQPAFEEVTPLVDWQSLGIEIARVPRSWSSSSGQFAAVSSFGISGTNAHVILEPGPVQAQVLTEPRGSWVLPLSARTPSALRARVSSMANALRDSNIRLEDFVYSASVRRTHMNYRTAVVGDSREQLVQRLDVIHVSDVLEARRARVVFLFSGHGSQWATMGRSLMAFEVCRKTFEECERALSEYVEWSLIEELTSDGNDDDWASVDRAQPMIFAVEIALAQLWDSWGVKADAVIGHSMGEVAAFYHAGALSLADAARIICSRSRLMRQIEGQGEMLVLGVCREEAETWIEPFREELAIGVHNSPDAVVLSGSARGIACMIERAQERNLFSRRVNINVASHSPQTSVLRQELLRVLEPLEPAKSSIPVFSTVLAEWVEDTSACDGLYWFRNLRDTVRFMPSIIEIAKDEHSVFVELSPHSILTTAVKRILAHANLPGKCFSSMRRDTQAERVLHEAAAGLYSYGVDLDWSRITSAGQLTTLPSYPFDRRRCWLDLPERSRSTVRTASEHPFLGEPRNSALAPDHTQWPVEIDSRCHKWLTGHKVRAAVIFPATASLELAFAVGQQCFGERPGELSDIEFLEPILVRDDMTTLLQVETKRIDATLLAFSLVSSVDGCSGEWITHVRGYIRANRTIRRRHSRVVRPNEARSITRDECYAYLRNFGLEYGASFQGITRVEVQPAHAIAKVEAPRQSTYPWCVEPMTLDACLHTLGLAKLAADPTRGVSIPRRLDRVTLFGECSGELYVEARSHGQDGDLTIRDEVGQEIIRFERLLGYELPSPPRDNRFRPPWSNVLAEQEAMEVIWRRRPIDGDKMRVAERVIVIGELEWFGAESLERNSGWACRLEDKLGGHVDRVVFMASVSDSTLDGMKRELLALATTVKTIVSTSTLTAPQLVVVTNNAVQINASDPVLAPTSHVVVRSAAHSIAQEHPELRCICVDIDSNEATLAVLPQVCHRTDSSSRIALRSGALYHELLSSDVAPVQLTTRLPIATGGTHLVTGGFGAIGRELVATLAKQGASKIVICSRAPRHKELEALKKRAENDDCSIFHERIDVANVEAISELVDRLRAEQAPLRGVWHLAGVLDDQMTINVTHSTIDTVFDGKVGGVLNLASAFNESDTLEHFVVMSSASSVLGSPGQSVYAAANAVLDSIIAARRDVGLPGISVALGPVEGAGMAYLGRNASRLHARGIPTIDISSVIPLLAGCMERSMQNLVPLMVNMTLLSKFHPSLAHTAFFSNLDVSMNTEQTDRRMGRDEAFIARLEASPRSVQIRFMESFLQEQIAQMLGVPRDMVSRTRSVQEHGFDSLLTLELRNQLETILGARLTVSFLWRHSSLELLAPALLDVLNLDVSEGLLHSSKSTRDTHKASWLDDDPDTIDPSLTHYDEDQLLALLNAELDPT